MTFKQHLSLTTGLTLLTLPFLEDRLCALFFWFGGIFIDVDHCVDYVRERGRFTFNLSAMEGFFFNLQVKKLYCVLHSYELLVALWCINFFFFHSSYGYSLLLGCVVHLVADSIYNPVHWKSYFFFYRLKHEFALEKLLQK